MSKCVIKPCFVLLVEYIRSIAQQQVARALQDFALVDVLFQPEFGLSNPPFTFDGRRDAF